MPLTYGVEIEFFLPASHSSFELATHLSAAGVQTEDEMYNHSRRDYWKIVTDGSLGDYDRGRELVSPILQGDDFAAVRAACDALVSFGCKVDRRCGLHVHVGAPTGTVDFFKNLIAAYAKHESVIDSLLARSRRGDNNVYCRAVGQNPRVQAARTLDTLRSAYSGSNHNRYRKLNLEAYWRHGTVEYRQHQGTIDADKVEYWARFCLKMTAAALAPRRPARAGRVDRNARITRLAMRSPYKAGSCGDAVWWLCQTGSTYGEVLDRAIVACREISTSPVADTYASWYLNDARKRGLIAIGDATSYSTFDGLMTAIDADNSERAFFARRRMELAA